MALQRQMMGVGTPPAQASAITGSVQLGQTALGSSQATAFAITAAITEFTTTAASTGAILPATGGIAVAGDRFTIVNLGAQTLSVYPAVGFAISGGSTNAAFSVATLKTADFICRGDGSYFALLSA